MLKATFREREQLIAHYEGELIPGPQGPAGPQGVGISTIEKTGTSGLVDTYTITLTNGDTTTFEVTNGEDGEVTTAAMNAAIEAALSAYSEGDYPDMQVGGLFSDEYIVDTAPYIFRQTAGGKKVGNRERDKLVGGTVAWNQIFSTRASSYSSSGVDFVRGADGKFSYSGTSTAAAYIDAVNATGMPSKFIAGHRYLLRANSTDNRLYIVVNNPYTDMITVSLREIIYTPAGTPTYFMVRVKCSNGETVNGSGVVQVTDLTQMFGSTIADYVYALEQQTAGSGIAWLKKYDLIDDQYHAYSAGSLESVNVSAHVTVGFNQWDEEWETGTIDVDTGVNVESNARMRSKNLIPLIPNTEYAFTIASETEPFYAFRVVYYDASGQYIYGTAYFPGESVATSPILFTTPANAYFMRFSTPTAYGATYKGDICINLSKTTGTPKNGDYVPYVKRTYPTSPVTLRGILKTDDNGNLYYDGDTYEWDGTVTRKYAEVDLGTLNWAMGFSGFYTQDLKNVIKTPTDYSSPTAICPTFSWGTSGNGTFFVQNYPTYLGWIIFRTADYATPAEFKTAMSGVYLVYELIESAYTTESADPYTNPQVCDPDGTEEWTDYGVAQGTRDYAVPVGHETNYIPDLSANTINDRITALEDGTYTPDNPTAAANVTSGKYFMVGSVLYKATASIAAGDKIVVGTNCTKPSIADALNSLS